MITKDELSKYFQDGFIINGPIIKISEILGDKQTSKPLDLDQTLIQLWKDQNTIKILTKDEEVIQFAKQKQEDQNTPIATLICIVCEIAGTNVAGQENFDHKSFINALNETSKWEFKSLENDSKFTIENRIESLEEHVVDEQIEFIQNSIDLLAYYQNVGIFIHSVEKSYIPKFGPVLIPIGTDRKIEIPSKELVSNIVNNYACSGNNRLHTAAHGLNLSYVENCLQNRVSMLWATTETLFNTKPKHLLKKEEKEKLLKGIEYLDILKSESDKWRLKKLKNTIKDSGLLSFENRNERIAASISKELNIDYIETLKMIQFISRIRGKNLHGLIKEEKVDLIKSEEYLQGILKAYIEKNINAFLS